VDGAPARAFHAFASSAELLAWVRAVSNGEQVQHAAGMLTLVLERGSFLDVELVGYEYAYDVAPAARLNHVRMALAQRTSNAAGLLVSIYQGWVTDGMLPLRAGTWNGFVVRALAAADEQLDLAALFESATRTT